MTGKLIGLGIAGGVIALALAMLRGFLHGGRVQKRRLAELEKRDSEAKKKAAQRREQIEKDAREAQKKRVSEAADRVEARAREREKDRQDATSVSGSDVGDALDERLRRR